MTPHPQQIQKECEMIKEARSYKLLHCWCKDECQCNQVETCKECYEKYCASHSNQQSERDKVLDEFCRCDLYDFATGNMVSEDVALCRGIECNWCGRWNKEFRSKGGEQVDVK
jgi:hypothetical protein